MKDITNSLSPRIEIMKRAIIYIFVLSICCAAAGNGLISDSTVLNLTLGECIEMALEKNHLRPASLYAVTAAKAQYKQALSGHWPQFSTSSGYSIMDEAPNFIFPSLKMSLPPVDLGIFKMELGPINVPEQDLKLMDNHNWLSSLRMTFPLYKGGLFSAYKKQASAGIKVAEAEARQTDLQIILDIKKYYYGSVLVQQLNDLAKEALIFAIMNIRERNLLFNLV